MGSVGSSRSRKLCIFVSLLALGAAACGGGGGGSGPSAGPQPVTVTFTATPGLDGYVDSSGGVSPFFGIYVGDFDGQSPGEGCRGFVSFDTSAIPAGATIDAAEFRIYQIAAIGNAFNDHGFVYVYRVDFGDALEFVDFDGPAQYGDIVSQSVVAGYRSVPVERALRDVMLVGETRAQFRMQFLDQDSDGDTASDGLWFEDAENSQMSGNVPQLVVTYTPPQ